MLTMRFFSGYMGSITAARTMTGFMTLLRTGFVEYNTKVQSGVDGSKGQNSTVFYKGTIVVLLPHGTLLSMTS